jgi:hypothetical protein
LQTPHDGRTHHPAMAGNVDFCVFFDGHLGCFDRAGR